MGWKCKQLLHSSAADPATLIGKVTAQQPLAEFVMGELQKMKVAMRAPQGSPPPPTMCQPPAWLFHATATRLTDIRMSRMNTLPDPDVVVGGNEVYLRTSDHRGVLCRGMCLHAIRPAASR